MLALHTALYVKLRVYPSSCLGYSFAWHALLLACLVPILIQQAHLPMPSMSNPSKACTTAGGRGTWFKLLELPRFGKSTNESCCLIGTNGPQGAMPSHSWLHSSTPLWKQINWSARSLPLAALHVACASSMNLLSSLSALLWVSAASALVLWLRMLCNVMLLESDFQISALVPSFGRCQQGLAYRAQSTDLCSLPLHFCSACTYMMMHLVWCLMMRLSLLSEPLCPLT